MTCRRRVVSVAFMEASLVRRRGKDPCAVLGVPPELAVFDPLEWPGTSDYQRWASWFGARRSWAEANLPNRFENMPSGDSKVPDMPWDEVEL